ncbi:MAG: glycoside hydrolase family 127 protein [Armatimonadota bacterium]
MTTSASTSRSFRPIPFTRVRITDAFWAPRIQVNRERTLPAEYRQCKDTGRIDAFRLDWQPGMEHEPHVFWDSDVAKWVEAASYSLATHPDPALAALLDEVVSLIVSAQQPDGYLNTHYTTVEPEQRWSNLRDCHELYCAGHLIEAAVAHFQATGQRNMLDAMCRYADYIDSVFGVEPGKQWGYCGHEEIELALVKLYHITGEARYLRLSQYFIDERGRQPYYFDQEAKTRGENPVMSYMGRYEYCQAHHPVREQTAVVGHAVRAMYLYSAMADLAGELDDDGLRRAGERLWEDLCLQKMYLTGGIGPSKHNEGFTTAYDLPNDTAYAETCAAIGLVFWNHRLLQLDCDSRYADVMERALYNGVISGVSLDGEKFFYVNPLASDGTHHRQDWFGCSCCPTNIVRLLASLGEYAYSESNDGVAIHLYLQGEADCRLPDGTRLTLAQQTNYPWDGQVRVTIGLDAPADFTLRLRIPGWCRHYTATINGLPAGGTIEKGYLCLNRHWKPDDTVTMEFPITTERIAAHPRVQQDRTRVALQRGPLVYCLEGVDNEAPVHQIILPDDTLFVTRFNPDLLGGVVVIEGDALAIDAKSWRGALYQPAELTTTRPIRFRAIPYYAWDNRGPGEMVVWLPRVIKNS